MRIALFALLATASVALAEPTNRPNIVFIMSDDHAVAAISSYGSKVNQTPHLDALASEGMRLDRCFATNSICSPSRATILTGKYSHKNGVKRFDPFDGSQTTVAKLLQSNGYHTGLIGKWHLGTDPTGFDVWSIVLGQGLYENPIFYDATKQRTRIPGYATDIITDKAIDFLRHRPADKPFFLMCHHKAPHRPFTPSQAHRDVFADKIFPEPLTLWDDYVGRSDGLKINAMRISDLTRNDLKLPPPAGLSSAARDAWLREIPMEVEVIVDGQPLMLRGKELTRWMYQRYMQDYLAAVQSVDDNVGRLVQYLDNNGLRENTIVIYTSDQGFFLGEHGLFDKRYMYDPSIRMPFIIRWPGVIARGSVSAALATNVDFAQTFLEAANVEVPNDMQGASLLPILKGKTPDNWRKQFYYRYYIDGGEHNTAAHYGIRTDTHKLIYFDTLDQWELFDLNADPEEMQNLYDDPEQADRIRELKAGLAALRQQLDDTEVLPATMPVLPSLR